MSLRHSRDIVMLLTTATAVIALSLATVSSSAPPQQPALMIDPLSATLMRQGNSALELGKIEQAIGLYESALAVDPRNAPAYVALGHLARQQKLHGKAIHLYRQALALDGSDRMAIAGEGAALAAKGAVARARQNLARVEAACAAAECPEAAMLLRAIAIGPEQPIVQASAVTGGAVAGASSEPKQP